jgi:hypothetical protein
MATLPRSPYAPTDAKLAPRPTTTSSSVSPYSNPTQSLNVGRLAQGARAAGGSQIIGGTEYRMYSPEWYAAMDRNKVQQAGVAGEAAGTQTGTAINTLRGLVPDLNDLSPTGGSSSTSSSSSGSGVGSVPRATMPGGLSSPGQFPGAPGSGGGMLPQERLRLTDTTAADAARFGRAKDQVGDITRSSLTGLRSALASRGQLGGGGESHGTAAIFTKGQGDLGNMVREQAIQGSERDAERAGLEFTGGISQRGQDLSAQQAANALAQRMQEVAYQGDITQRGQDLSSQQFNATLNQQNNMMGRELQLEFLKQALAGLRSY